MRGRTPSPAFQATGFVLGDRPAAPVDARCSGIVIATMYTLKYESASGFDSYFYDIMPRVFATPGNRRPCPPPSRLLPQPFERSRRNAVAVVLSALQVITAMPLLTGFAWAFEVAAGGDWRW
jgi:hypothetical protein